MKIQKKEDWGPEELANKRYFPQGLALFELV